MHGSTLPQLTRRAGRRLRRALATIADGLDVSPARLVLRAVLLVAGVIGLYVLAPEILAGLETAPVVLDIFWLWLVLMVVAEAASLVALALLVWVLSPRRVSWVDALLVQLAATSATLAVPGGAAVGGAASVRLLARSGMSAGQAGGVLTASSLLSTATISALAPVAAGLAFLSADDVPDPLVPVIVAGSALAVALLVVGWVLLTTEWPLRAIAALGRGLDRLVLRRLRNPLDVDAGDLARGRRDLRDRLEGRWVAALACSGANWLLDFAALGLALMAVDADISIGLALVAFVTAAVLRMIPITPGGLGFVEGGLTSVLTIAGLPALGALVVALAYRAASFWLPIPVGGVAYLLHRRRHPVPT